MGELRRTTASMFGWYLWGCQCISSLHLVQLCGVYFFWGGDHALAGFGGEMAGWALKACAGSPSGTLSCTWICRDPSIHPCAGGEAGWR